MVALHAEFDQYQDEPVPMQSVTINQIGLPANYHHQLQETWQTLLFAIT